MLPACRRRNSAQLDSRRRGAGSTPWRRRISHTVLAASEIPSPSSSPWIRRYPQPGFSLASRTTSSRTLCGVPGRPGRRCGYVQRRDTSSRCQRSSVAGVTKNDGHARRGSVRLNAASSARSSGRSCGRVTWRPSTCSWWRRTRISISFSRSERIRSTNSSSNRRSIQYRNNNPVPRERPTSTSDPTDTAPTSSARTEPHSGRSQFPAPTRSTTTLARSG